jgi:dihydrofolate reductase
VRGQLGQRAAQRLGPQQRLNRDWPQERAGNWTVYASATLTDTLREHDLVDEYRLMVHPVVLGSGKRMFKENAAGTGLTLIDYRKVGPDVVLLTYGPAAAKPDQPDGEPAS